MNAVIILVILSIQSPEDVKDLRERYEKAYDDAKIARNEYDRLKQSDRSALQTGYLGATMMLLANHHWNPITKLTFFQKGKTHLEEAIKINPNSVELRYLRFVNQVESPSILGYKSDMKDDKRIIIAGYGSIDKDLQGRIAQFMLNSDGLTKTERMTFK